MLLSKTMIAQEKTDTWLWKMMINKASPFLKNVLLHPDSFQYQLIYTRIGRTKNNAVRIKNYYLHTDKNRYFNPASMVKMPIAFLAIEKVNELRVEGLNI